MKFLFDLGGVFFDWDPHYFYKDVIEDKEERDYFLNNICNDEWNIQQDAGRLIKDAETDLIKTYPDYEDRIKFNNASLSLDDNVLTVKDKKYSYWKMFHFFYPYK